MATSGRLRVGWQCVLTVAAVAAACSPAADGDTPGPVDGGDGASETEWVTALEEAVDYAATSPDRFRQHLVLTLEPFPVTDGEVLELAARALVTGDASRRLPVLAALRLSCGPVTGPEATGAWTYANWEGGARQPDGVTVRVRDLVVVERGGPWRCALHALSGAGTLGSGDEVAMRVLPGRGVTEIGIRRVRPSPLVATRWGEAVVDGPEVPPGSSERVLRFLAEVPDGVGHLEARADLQLSSCPPTAEARGWCRDEGTGAESVVATRLFLAQLEPDTDAICALTAAPPVAEDPILTTITNAAHHVKVFHELDATPDPACRPEVGVWVDLRTVTGNPVKVDVATPSGLLSVAGLHGG